MKNETDLLKDKGIEIDRKTVPFTGLGIGDTINNFGKYRKEGDTNKLRDKITILPGSPVYIVNAVAREDLNRFVAIRQIVSKEKKEVSYGYIVIETGLANTLLNDTYY